jgi:hypothetical protein
VDALDVIFHVHPGIPGRDADAHRWAIRDAGCRIVHEWCGGWSVDRKKAETLFMVEKGLKSDWLMTPDVDEFVRFEDGGVRHVADLCEDNGWNYVQGVLVDHVTSDGSLPAIRKETSVWEQFSAVYPVTSGIAYGLVSKICLFRPGLSISMGHHEVCDPRGRKADLEAHVHHFKYDETLPRRLRLRIAANDLPREESRRLLSALECSGDGRYLFRPAL